MAGMGQRQTGNLPQNHIQQNLTLLFHFLPVPKSVKNNFDVVYGRKIVVFKRKKFKRKVAILWID
jgi:hypothetical protein